MSQIPILNGIFSDTLADYRSSYPRNLIPVPKSNGVSAGYLRPAEGIAAFATGPGVDRGGIVWNGACYRVMGTSLVKVNADGTVTIIDDVGDGGTVSFDYSFDALGICSGGRLYYYNGTTFVQVTDPDLGTAIDMIWKDGYFITTDGTSLVASDLNDPTSINPLHYGSSEADPDPIMGVLKRGHEVCAVNRYTIESFYNVGGAGFPFQRNDGALIERGAIGTHAKCVYMEQIAFLGSGKNEPPAVYVGANGSSQKISTREIDTILQGYTEAQLSLCTVETRADKSHQHLLIHLPDQCIVFDGAASQALGEPVWFTLDSGTADKATYRARHFVWCYDKWLAGDPTSAQVGTLDGSVSTHYGNATGWQFGTAVTYNAGFGAIFHQLELACLPGRVALGLDPVVWASYSEDGETWSVEQPCRAGRQGERTARISWLRQGRMSNVRMYKFRGTSDAHVTFARLEVQVEPLNA